MTDLKNHTGIVTFFIQEQEMKQELVEWEKEEQERRGKELAIQQGQQILSLAEVTREKSTPERVSFVLKKNYSRSYSIQQVVIYKIVFNVTI
jgi:hypothetical protein